MSESTLICSLLNITPKISKFSNDLVNDNEDNHDDAKKENQTDEKKSSFPLGNFEENI